MTLTPDRIEQNVSDALSGADYIVMLPRSLVLQMLKLSKDRQAEIERLTAENARLRAERLFDTQVAS